MKEQIQDSNKDYFDEKSNRFFSYVELIDESVEPTIIKVEKNHLGLKITSSSGIRYEINADNLDIRDRKVMFISEQTFQQLLVDNDVCGYRDKYVHQKDFFACGRIDLDYYRYEVKKTSKGTYCARNNRRGREETFATFDEAVIHLINREFLADRGSDEAMAQSNGDSIYEYIMSTRPARRDILIKKGYGILKD